MFKQLDLSKEESHTNAAITKTKADLKFVGTIEDSPPESMISSPKSCDRISPDSVERNARSVLATISHNVSSN